MNIRLFLLAVSLLAPQASALLPFEFKTPTSGFHIGKSPLANSTGFRLPPTARPVNYSLTFDFSLSATEQPIKATVVIYLDVDEENDPNSIKLNSEIEFNKKTSTFTWLNGKDSFACELSGSGAEFIQITCPNKIIGKNQALTIQYSTEFIENDLYGAYVTRYMEDDTLKVMATTQFEEVGARRLFPSFDEPQYKVPFELTLITNANNKYNIASWVANTAPLRTQVHKDGYTTTVFTVTPPMSTYLLAFVATQDFQSYTTEATKDKSYSFSVYARPSANGLVDTALSNGPLLIDAMGDFLGIPYESLGIDKLTLAAIPEFAAGAMENWGLITFRETLLIDEKAKTTARDEQLIVEVIAHELTHQWFGDYVTMNWWSETWLNEGFAEYFEYALTNLIHPEYEMPYQLIVKGQQAALKADASSDSIPLSNNASDVTTQDDFSNEFGSISYSKGASIVKMIRYAIGDEAFKKGLKAYLSKNAHSSVTSEILLNALQNSLEKPTFDLTVAFHEWIYNAGYPILNVQYDSDDNKITLQATKFLYYLSEAQDVDKASIWNIPLTYTTSEKTDFETVAFTWASPSNLTDIKVKFPSADDSWIVFNLQGAGFYRVNYDDTLWNRLVNVLNKSDTFSNVHVVNRAQLIDDAFNIPLSIDGSDSDQLKKYYLRAFDLAEYMKYETDYHPWYTYLVEMDNLLSRLQDEQTVLELKKIVLEAIYGQLPLPLYMDSSNHTTKLKKSLLATYACRLESDVEGYTNCTSWALGQFKNYKANTTSIDYNYRVPIVCAGLTDYSKENLDFVTNLMNSSIYPLEQMDLANALSCVRNEDALNAVLDLTIADEVPKFSRLLYKTILSSFASGGYETQKVALKFIFDKSDNITQRWTGIETPEALLKSIASKIYSQDLSDELQNYVSSKGTDENQDSMVKAAKEALKTVEKNLKWVDQYEPILTSVLLYNGGDPPTPSGVEQISFNILFVGLLMAIIKLLSF